MPAIFMVLALTSTLTAQQRTVSYRMQIDTSGRVYLTSQVVEQIGDTIDTRVKTIRFDSVQAALPVVRDLQQSVDRTLQNLRVVYSANQKNAQELGEIADALVRLQNPTPSDQKPQQSQAELEKLKAENAELKAKLGKQDGG